MRLTRSVIALLVRAAIGLSVTGAAQAADDPAVETVRALYTSFEGALKSNPGDVSGRVSTIGPVMAEAFDFPTMVRVSVGPRWNSFTPEQQGALTENFGRFFTATYATRMVQAVGGKFEVKPASEARAPNRVVQTEITTASGDASQVDFLISPGNRVQDVYLNGDVSEVATLRGRFGDALKSGGADGLLTFLRDRTTTMLAAKPKP